VETTQKKGRNKATNGDIKLHIGKIFGLRRLRRKEIRVRRVLLDGAGGNSAREGYSDLSYHS